MRYILIIYILFFISCRAKTEENNEQFFYVIPMQEVDVSNDKFYKEFVIRMNETPEKFIKYLTDTTISSQILKTKNYYNLYNISKVEVKNKSLDVRIIYGEYDYYRDLILVSIKGNKIVDFNIVSTSEGDGGDFLFKKSKANANDFITSSLFGENLYSTPFDTFNISLYLKSKLSILNNGCFKNDTISIKRNYMLIEPPNFDISKNY